MSSGKESHSAEHVRRKMHDKATEGASFNIGNVMLGALRLSGAGIGERGSVHIAASDAASGNRRADGECGGDGWGDDG